MNSYTSSRLNLALVAVSIFFLPSLQGNAQVGGRQQLSLPLVPKPTEIYNIVGGTSLNYNPKTTFYLSSGLANTAEGKSVLLMAKRLDVNLKVATKTNAFTGVLIESIEIPKVKSMGPEAYKLTADSKNIKIYASTLAGKFYGLQTTLQFLYSVKVAELPLNLKAFCIEDKPRYSYRGMHLDCSRHFFSIPFIYKMLDAMALHKLNNFHWHLTDDQGWRIEIKKYPLLTSVGGMRNGTRVGFIRSVPEVYDDVKYGGFYTQAEAKAVVAYAAARHINVVPEIEMPGHAQAAITAYPYLGCTSVKTEVWKNWGVSENVFNVNDSTFNFLENVLTEVMAIFPSKIIHIGGDEVPKTQWKQSAVAQSLMTRNHLATEEDLQSYFIKRIETFVNRSKRDIIGWDEILEGGLAPNAMVMSWRGTKGGIAAAKLKHKVVMTPGQFCYLDSYQSADRDKEPLAIGGNLSLKTVYSYNPTPDTLADTIKPYIIGLQANLWTEYIKDAKQLEYMAFPRLAAIAETGWLDDKGKNYDDFKLRMDKLLKLYTQLDINYRKPQLND